MSDSAYEAGAVRFSIGTVFSRSFSALCKHPLVFIGLSLMTQIPGILITVITLFSRSVYFASFSPMIAQVVTGIFGLVFQGAIAYGVYEALLGRGARFGQSMSRGLRRIFPLTGAVLSYILFLAVVALVAYALIFTMPNVAMVLVVIAIDLLVMVMLACKWSLFVPACVVERLGPIESLNRSSDLTKGCRLKIFCFYLLCGILIFVVSYVVGLILRFLLASLMSSILGTIIIIVIHQFLLAIPIAFYHITTSAAYYGLREVKEGVSIEQLTNVFD